MPPNRVFFPQQALDLWLEEGRVLLVGDELSVSPEGRRFAIESAVRFMAEVAEGEDPQELVGKVKTLEQVTALGGEYASGSVILGDSAYEVIEGFLGTNVPVPGGSTRRAAKAPSDELAALLKQP